MQSTPLLLTISQVCELLACSRSSVNRLIRSGELESLKFGRSRRIRPEAVQRFITRNERAQRRDAVSFT